jgi:hypothetical protein
MEVRYKGLSERRVDDLARKQIDNNGFTACSLNFLVNVFIFIESVIWERCLSSMCFTQLPLLWARAELGPRSGGRIDDSIHCRCGLVPYD